MANETALKSNKEIKKKKSGITIFIIFLLLIGAAGAGIRLDFLGLSSKYLEKPLRNIPLVKYVLPPNKAKDPYANISKAQLMQEIDAKNRTIQEAEEQVDMLNKQLKAAQDEITRLDTFEKQVQQFDEDKKAFDEAIAEQDKKSFMELYERMNPDTAKQIYQELQGQEIKLADIKKNASAYAVMEPENAAKIMSEMIKTDVNLVVAMLKVMKAQDVAEILSSMDAKDAARLTKLLSPEQ